MSGILSVEELVLLGEAAALLARVRDNPSAAASISEAAGLSVASLRILLDHVILHSPPDALDGWL